MTTTVTYAVNFAGDFTTLAAAFAGFGSDLTVSSTGLTLQAGSTTTSIVLSASEGASDYKGHPLTIGATTCLITAYNAGTKTATVSARAGFPAAFGSSPSAGTAYTVAAAAAVLTIGQSAAGNNLWTNAGTLAMGAITTSGSSTITLQGATAQSFAQPLRVNTTGATAMPVCITGSNAAVTIAPANVIVNDLHFWNQTNSAFTPAAAITINRCAFECDQNNGSDFGILGSGGGTLDNCLFYGTSANSRPAAMDGATAFNGCLFFTNGDIPLLCNNAVATDCAFYGFTGSNTYKGAGNDGNFGCTMLRSAAPSNISTVGGITTIPLAGLFVTTTAPVDFRPQGGAAILGAGGAPGSPTDYYGVTRSLTASAIGMSENGFSPPAVQAVTYSVAFNGDIPDPAPNGTVASASWSAGVATITTAAAHGLAIGRQVLMYLNNNAYTASGYYQTPNNISSTYGALAVTITGTTTFTYPVVSNPGSIPANTLWVAQITNTMLGGLAADLTYYQQSLTCPSTAADSSHIVLDASVSAACLGHPVQWKTGTICLITGFNASTHTASVSALAGYPANFGGVPQSGDAYTVFPATVTFNYGLSASGNTLWAYDIFCPNAAAINVGPCVTSSTCRITLAGILPFNKNVALGTIMSSGSAVGIKNGNTISSVSDHTAVIGIAAGNLDILLLQIWDAGLNQGDGCLLLNDNVAAPVTVTQCMLRGDNATDDEQHSPFVGQSSFTFSGGITFTNCGMASQDFRAATQIQTSNFTLLSCTVVNTANVIAHSVGSTSSGSSTILLDSVAGIQSGATSGGDGSYVSCVQVPGSIAINTIVASISGNTITLGAFGGGSSPTTAIIPTGSTMLFGVSALGSGNPATVKNTASFGMQTSVVSAGFITATTSATDSNPLAISGFTTMAYPAQFRLASGVFGGTVDIRPLPGNSLQIGASLAGVTTDIYGSPRASIPTIGAVEFGGLAQQTFVIT